jgi:hypothetical protein
LNSQKRPGFVINTPAGLECQFESHLGCRYFKSYFLLYPILLFYFSFANQSVVDLEMDREKMVKTRQIREI